MERYSEDLEGQMRAFFRTLSEKDRRRYAAVEAIKLGHGGVEYVSDLFRIDPKTIRRGVQELALGEDPAGPRVRRSPHKTTNVGTQPPIPPEVAAEAVRDASAPSELPKNGS